MSVLSANGLCGLTFEVCAGEFSGSNLEVGEREMPFKTTYSLSNSINEASLERPMDKLSNIRMQIVFMDIVSSTVKRREKRAKEKGNWENGEGIRYERRGTMGSQTRWL